MPGGLRETIRRVGTKGLLVNTARNEPCVQSQQKYAFIDLKQILKIPCGSDGLYNVFYSSDGTEYVWRYRQFYYTHETAVPVISVDMTVRAPGTAVRA